MVRRIVFVVATIVLVTALRGAAPTLALDGADLRPRGKEDRCVDIFQFNDSNGAPLVLWECNDAINQRWAGGATIDGDIQSAWNGKCVTAVKRPEMPFRTLEMFDCTGGPDQHWVWDKRTDVRETLCLKFEPSQCLWWSPSLGLHVTDVNTGDGFRGWYFH
ncbi:MAG: hypothetical protein HOQ05_12180 [Corynebacteriales bacterium]|nr:hypothetical protein [Mycobacteriales bacterium]